MSAALGACAIALIVVTASPGHAQSLARRVQQAAPGTVRFSFAAQPDVCGDGENILRHRDDEPDRLHVLRGRNFRGSRRWAGDEGWPADCVFGPIIVTLGVRGRRFDSADVRVGDRAGLSDATEPELVRTALFWLGQSQDDRAIALFREILTRR